MPGPRNRLTRDAEAGGRGRAEQRRDLACGRGGLVHGPGETRRRRTGDPPPPGERGLARLGGVVGIRVRQRVAGRHVHQDERIEGDAQPARLHLLDRLHHGEVGRRAAIDRAILIVAADEEGAGAADAVHRPAGGRGRLGRHLDARPHLAGSRAQIVAEPRHDEADALDRRGHRLQPVQRLHHVGGVGQRVQVLRHRRAAIGLADGLRRVGELARGRDHGDGAGQPLGGVGIGERPEHLEGELRQAVAIGRERQLLEDDIGRAAIGGRAGRAHLRGDERIGRLRLVAGIPAPGDAGEVHRLAVGPDAADAGDRALAERHGEAGVVEILGGLDLAAPAALAAALRGGLRLLAEIGRPDDVAAHPHPAVEPRDDRAFGGRGDAQRVEPRALDALRGRQRRDDPAVDDRADGGADEAADGGGADAEDRAADRAANGGAGRAEDEGRHGASWSKGEGKTEADERTGAFCDRRKAFRPGPRRPRPPFPPRASCDGCGQQLLGRHEGVPDQQSMTVVGLGGAATSVANANLIAAASIADVRWAVRSAVNAAMRQSAPSPKRPDSKSRPSLTAANRSPWPIRDVTLQSSNESGHSL